MIFPKGKGFDLVCGLVITVVLDDLVTLTGTFLGEVRKRCEHKEFILIQLTCPFCDKGGLKIPEGTFCAINIDQVQFIIPGTTCQDKKHDNKCHDKCDDKKHDDKCHGNADNKSCPDKYHDKDEEKSCHNKSHEKKHEDKCHGKADDKCCDKCHDKKDDDKY